MTKKLKTLKDLPTWMPSARHSEQAGLWALMNSKEIGAMPPEDEGYISKNTLKYEAIKRIKTWRTLLNKGVWFHIPRPASNRAVFPFDAGARKPNDEKLIGMITIFVEFLNITEEDLDTETDLEEASKPELYLRSTTETVASGN